MVHVTVRTLLSKDAPRQFEVDLTETVSSFKKRLAHQLPYNGACKFLTSTTALPVATKKGNTQATLVPSKSDLPPKAEATVPGTSATTAANHTNEQHISTETARLPTAVVLPAAPAVLNHASVTSVLHPLPSVPLTGNAALGSATPSLGAWSPDQKRQATSAARTAAAAAAAAAQAERATAAQECAAATPAESGIWADLAAELKSAPISMPDLAQPSSSLLPATTEATTMPTPADVGAPTSDLHDKILMKSQAKRTCSKTVALAQQMLVENDAEESNKQAHQQPGSETTTGSHDLVQVKAPAKAARNAKQARSKDQPQQDSESQQLETSTQTAAKAPRRSRKGTAKSTAVTASTTEAQQGASEAAAAAATSPVQPAARGPAEKGKRGNFRGTGALGLSRRLSTQILTPQEANVLARLSLPPALHRLDQQLFPALNAMYGFLLRQHIQAGWRVLQDGTKSMLAPGEVMQLEDVQNMAELCPDVFTLRDPQIIQSPIKSIKQWRSIIPGQAPKLASLANPIDAEEASLVDRNASGSGELIPLVNELNPMEINTDGGGTVFQGQSRKDRLIVEIMDPYRKTTGANSIAEMGVDIAEDGLMHEAGLNARSLSARLPTRKDAEGKPLKGRAGQTDRGAQNAQQRRQKAFRQSLVKAVMPAHQAFLELLKQQQQHHRNVNKAVSVTDATQSDRSGRKQQKPQQAADVVAKSHKDKAQTSHPTPVRRSQRHSTMSPNAQHAADQPQTPAVEAPATAASDEACPCCTLMVPVEQTCAANKITPAETAFAALSSKGDSPGGSETGPDPILQAAANSAGHEQQELDWDVMERKAWHPLFPLDQLGLPTIFRYLKAARRADSESLPKRAGSCHDCDFPDASGNAKAPARPPQVARRHQPCTDTTHMGTVDFLKHIQGLPWYAEQIVHMEDIPARAPRCATPHHALSPETQAALAARKVTQLFTHQAQAIDAVMDGHNVVVSTSTASGKSLCYNIPILEALVQDKRACALYMFPTKALAQDQLRALRQMCEAAFGDQAPYVEVYDGDTIRADRGELRERAQLLITNPDMLHRSILPVHSQFSRILAHLKYVVVDEGHAYKGVFGCHTALVLRRLRRLCNHHYNNHFSFVVTSATVANPQQHVQELLGVEDVQVISEDGSPHGPKCFVLWNPPLTVSQKALDKGSIAKLSRTEGRARLTKGGPTKRARQEYVREELREANQARGAGMQLGGSSKGVDSLGTDAWLAQVRAGRKKQAVVREAEEVFKAAEAEADQVYATAPTATHPVTTSPQAAVPDNGQRSTATTAANNHRSDNISAQAGGPADVLRDGVVKQDPDADSEPASKRLKTPSAEAQAAMAIISATARLPSQAPATQVNSISYLHSEQPQNRAVIRRQLPSLKGLTQNIFKPGTTSGDNPHLSGLAQGVFKGPRRRQRENEFAEDNSTSPCVHAKTALPSARGQALPGALPGSGTAEPSLVSGQTTATEPSTEGLETHADHLTAGMNSNTAPEAGTTEVGDSEMAPEIGTREPQTEEEVREQIQARLPGTEWKARIGTAGTAMEQQRVSPIVELSMLLAECIQHGLRTLAFCKTRKLCELVTAYTRETLKQTAPHLAKSISVYRAGYSPQERREIESALHDGQLWAVAATNALELGVDVGSLDVTLHLGFPGSVASLWQQAGRAGRREQPSTSVYIAFDGPLDQYFMKDPAKLFGRAIEQAQVDAHNAQLLEQHVCCAALESPVMYEKDEPYFGPGLATAMQALYMQGLISRHPHTPETHALHYTGPLEVPAAAVSLRAIDPERYAIVNEEDSEVIEEIEESKAFYEVYDGAVYMFQGRTYLCKKLDLGTKVATVRAADLKYYTKTRDFTDVHVVGGHTAYAVKVGSEQYPKTTACCEAAIVTVRWLGFHRIWQGSGEVFDSVDLFLPDVQFGTQAAYIRVPRTARQRVRDAGLPFRDGLHAASHALLNVIPLYMMCNTTDMAAECDNPYDTRFRPERLLLYDKHPGGIGLAAQALPLFSVLLEKALQLIEGCSCKPASGCPGCVQHMDCGEYNAVLNKFSAIIVLQCTLEAEQEHRDRLLLQQQATKREVGGF